VIDIILNVKLPMLELRVDFKGLAMLNTVIVTGGQYRLLTNNIPPECVSWFKMTIDDMVNFGRGGITLMFINKITSLLEMQ